METPWDGLDKERRHSEIKSVLDSFNENTEKNRKQQNKFNKDYLKEQKNLVKITALLVLITLIIGIGSIITGIIISKQKPKPDLLLIVQENSESVQGVCINETSYPSPIRLKIANVGNRPALNTKLYIKYGKNSEFFDNYVYESKRIVEKVNFPFETDEVLPVAGEIIGKPQRIVKDKQVVIFLEDISEGEIINLVIQFANSLGGCGWEDDISFELKEEGYSISSDKKTIEIIY